MQVSHDQKFLIAVGRSRKTTQWQHMELLWSEFLDKLSTTTRTRETAAEYAAMNKNDKDTIKDVGGFVGGYLKNGKRNNASVVNRCLVCLDIDNADPGVYDDLDMTFINAYALYSTHSHTPEKMRLRLIMFTLLCLAKYGNAINVKNSGWVNREAREIFSLANIAVTTRRQALMVNDLWRREYVGFSNIVDNININVRIIDMDTDEPELSVTDFRNLGNQYMLYIGEDYIPCRNCGIVIKRTAPRMKYCRDCAIGVHIQKTIENRKLGVA